MTDTDVAILAMLIAAVLLTVAGVVGLGLMIRGWIRPNNTDAMIQRMFDEDDRMAHNRKSP